MKHDHWKTALTRTLSIAALAFLAACGDAPPDIHSLPREAKEYESAPVEEMDRDELVRHLNLLADEMTLATETGQFVEMHHLEIALTRALVALEPLVPAPAQQIVDTLKVVAVKIHETGHDQNQWMATTLEKTLRLQIEKLEGTLGQ